MSQVKFPIVGMQHRKPAPTIMALLPPDTPLFLVREPDNPHDTNAIQVWIENFAESFPESVDDVVAACTQEEIEAPDLSQPLMLGFIKAKAINDEVQGAEQLAPRIDKMVEDEEISSAAEIPCVLIYGESGRPALKIVTDEAEEEEEGNSD